MNPSAPAGFCAAFLALSSFACSSSDAAAPSEPAADSGPYEPDLSPLGGDRPVVPVVPSSYRPGTPVPLLVLLHGYGASGLIQSLYFGLPALAEQRGFILLAPNGTERADASRFWNATDACCDFDKSGVDDVAYLGSLVDEAKARFTIDPKRVYFAGHSNGGFMSYRMACERADIIAAVMSLAGSTYADVSRCHPSEPVSILQIHGTADASVLYEGGVLDMDPPMAAYPGAEQTVRDWATLDGCLDAPDTSAPLRDLVSDTPGPETSTTVYAQGCQPGGHAELWTADGAPHISGLLADFTPSWLDFLMAHPKP